MTVIRKGTIWTFKEHAAIVTYDYYHIGIEQYEGESVDYIFKEKNGYGMYHALTIRAGEIHYIDGYIDMKVYSTESGWLDEKYRTIEFLKNVEVDDEYYTALQQFLETDPAELKAVNKVVFNGETLIDLTGDTVTVDDVAKGKIFHLPNGLKAVGEGSGGSSGETVYVPGNLTEFTLTQNGWNGTTYTIDASAYTLESVQKAVLGYPINATLANNELITSLGLTLMGGKYSNSSLPQSIIVSALTAPAEDIIIGVFGLEANT